MALHWHGYSWSGGSVPDSQRRPEPDVGFRSNDYPPLVTGHWLLKPKRLVQGTWTDPDSAVLWLREQYEAAPEPNGPELETRLWHAADGLPRGNDATWAYWLPSGRFVHLTVVSCPRRVETGLRCPTGAA
jgi:hypothetical protein